MPDGACIRRHTRGCLQYSYSGLAPSLIIIAYSSYGRAEKQFSLKQEKMGKAAVKFVQL